jgi:hypothetical protein
MQEDRIIWLDFGCKPVLFVSMQRQRDLKNANDDSCCQKRLCFSQKQNLRETKVVSHLLVMCCITPLSGALHYKHLFRSTDKVVLSLQIIALCERFAGQDAKVTTVPLGILRVTRAITRLFQWTTDAADRLAFSEVGCA